ncbi:MAG: hypothetical protein KDB27_34630 [Planctomycetales bacterium]|nr:hypothetical protein [Planctomycetales bacterium]
MNTQSTSLSILICVSVACQSVSGQLTRPAGAPTKAEAMKILDYGGPRITRNGNVIFTFPNYDISSGGAPEYAGQGNGVARDPQTNQPVEVATRAIYKSPNGSWDGANFVLNPNYNYSYATNFYRNRIIRPLSKPTDECCESVWIPGLKFAKSVEDDREKATGFQPDMTIATKSPETWQRMYELSPKFVYGVPPVTTPQFGDSFKFPQRPKPSTEKSSETKTLLWNLDQSNKATNWDRLQKQSTRRVRRTTRQTLKRSTNVPQRLTPDSASEPSAFPPKR